ncbi:hypothetical protein CY34DRAFT_708534 [Suillus luteus UH-Slu-Lm8-n1]|uniref:Uncharacterized protein n=1 Tax=Suillus luteus UH-Slu-Lm8-n1 TaxID=930992 RepID=A0A0D0AP34_9AGAM|nr:hypothetical protein CY34DRAFT_708534 [Suillus luteus UH-Slu-Lm8-n1]
MGCRAGPLAQVSRNTHITIVLCHDRRVYHHASCIKAPGADSYRIAHYPTEVAYLGVTIIFLILS